MDKIDEKPTSSLIMQLLFDRLDLIQSKLLEIQKEILEIKEIRMRNAKKRQKEKNEN